MGRARNINLFLPVVAAWFTVLSMIGMNDAMHLTPFALPRNRIFDGVEFMFKVSLEHMARIIMKYECYIWASRHSGTHIRRMIERRNEDDR